MGGPRPDLLRDNFYQGPCGSIPFKKRLVPQRDFNVFHLVRNFKHIRIQNKAIKKNGVFISITKVALMILIISSMIKDINNEMKCNFVNMCACVNIYSLIKYSLVAVIVAFSIGACGLQK